MKMKDMPKTKPCEKCGTHWWNIGNMECINGKWVKFMTCTKCGNKVPYSSMDKEDCDD